MFKVPILLIAYNRPNKLRTVIELLHELKPSNIYIAIDGPKNDADKIKVDKVKIEIQNINWDCKMYELISERNQGCKNGVIQAINWFFENVNEGIILEDDILPDISFFKFAEELLEKYRYDTRIFQIGGTNYNFKNIAEKYSYFFTKYVSIWGWATWKRAWEHFDKSLDILDENIDFLSISFKNEKELAFQINNFRETKNENIDTWDYLWSFFCLSNNGMTILPKYNLIKNIGFGEDSTHTNEPQEELKVYKCEFPLQHPSYIIRSLNFENEYFKGASLIKRIYNFIQNVRNKG